MEGGFITRSARARSHLQGGQDDACLSVAASLPASLLPSLRVQQALCHGQNPGPRGLWGLPSVPRYQESLPLLGAARLFSHLLPLSPLPGPPEGHLSHSTCGPAKPGGWTAVAVGRRGRGMHTSWPLQGPSPTCPGCFSIHPLRPSLWEEKDLLLELEPPPWAASLSVRCGGADHCTYACRIAQNLRTLVLIET